jgi:hypothetical protein
LIPRSFSIALDGKHGTTYRFLRSGECFFAWRTKSEYDIFGPMPVRSCRVTITDMEGVAHTVEVTASSLYEAVAQALTALRGKEWVVGIPDGFAPVKVRVLDIPVDHEVKMKDFTSWLDRRGNSPKEAMDRKKIRGILGLSGSSSV